LDMKHTDEQKYHWLICLHLQVEEKGRHTPYPVRSIPVVPKVLGAPPPPPGGAQVMCREKKI
jgi:hypothetical protein